MSNAGKYAKNSEDQEDFEQEMLIKNWLESEGNHEFDFKHITSKGTARNTLIKASISLDQKINDNESGTFADIIAGSDGRDLFDGNDTGEVVDLAGEVESVFKRILGCIKSDEARNWASETYNRWVEKITS